jgi:tetratricopeptide (TPR) repeat protein
MKISDVLYRLIGANPSTCPDEADILAYSENRLPATIRARLERHFVRCEDCREVLAFLGREPDLDKGAPLSEQAAAEQTARVLGLIRTDEARLRTERGRSTSAAVLQISLPRLVTLSLVGCALLAAVVYVITRQSQAEVAMEALRLAVQNKRPTPLRVSGGLEYSPYSITRGGGAENSGLHFNRALLKLQSAEQETAPTSDRLVLARIYLARGNVGDAKRALEILQQVASRGVVTAESLNDTGVAHFQLDDYETAIDYFSRALAKSPAYDEALFNRAIAEESANRIADARRDWEQFIAQSKDESWKMEARSRLKALGDGKIN